MRNQYSQRGFTLLEGLMAIAIFITVGGISVGVFLSQAQILRQSQQIVDQQTTHARLLRELSFDLRSTLTIDSTSTSTQLVLNVPSFDASRQLLPALDQITYSVTNGTLFRTVVPDPTSSNPPSQRRIADNVSAFVVQYDAAEPENAGGFTTLVLLQNPSVDAIRTPIRITSTLQ